MLLFSAIFMTYISLYAMADELVELYKNKKPGNSWSTIFILSLSCALWVFFYHSTH